MPASPRPRRKPAASGRPRPQPRRRQADRTADTRRRIIGALVACIDEIGFQKTTAIEITRRAGVTWGAVQHHFGGKDGILAAVLEDSFERFERTLGDIPDARQPGVSLEQRVSLFVERAWEHFASPHYRSTFEILLSQAQVDDGVGDGSGWRATMDRAWAGVWTRIFGDAPLSQGRTRIVQHYAVAVLSGLASMKVIEGPDAQVRVAELRLLEETLVRELQRGLAAADPQPERQPEPKRQPE